MPNHNQLEALTSTQASLIDAALSAGSLKVSELVKIHWPSPDGAKVYSWWNCLADSAYTTPLTAWLAGDPLVPGFIAQDEHKAERFHTITRTADLSDDVVSMRVVNYGRTFEGLCYQHRGGVKVEFFYFFPEIADDAAGTAYSVINWFTGHLRKADSANEDFVNVSVRKGIRSPQVLVPSRVPASNCQWYFNGEHAAGIADNPCDYDRHLAGTRGTLNGGSPWTSCNHTLNQGTNNCLAIMGDSLSYGGDDYTIESTLIGRGDHKTRSTTIGNEIRLENLPVLYGEWHIKQLQLARYAKEYNPSEDNQDQGTIRTVFKVSEGPIQEITEVKVMDRDLPRTDGLGLEVRLGTQRQSATTYSADMLNLNRTAHIRGDVNPVDPTGVQAQDILGECKGKGRNTVNIYAADATYTQAYTYNRADCFTDLLLNQWYGYRMDKARLSLDDVVYLRALSSNFHAYVQQRTVQQLFEDICLAAVGGGSPGWFRPFWYNGKLRILPILNTNLALTDIPQIKSNFGSTRNVIIDPSTKLARIEPFYRDHDEIPTAYTVTINDAQHGSIERPITFNADLDQYKEGSLYGDSSKRRDPRTVAGFGLTTEAEARVLGEFLVKMGPFATGGLMNNCSVTFTICAVSSIGLNLHENKIVKLPTASNDRLEKYTDTDSNQFQYFMVTGMRRTPRLELEVTAQAWAKPFWDDFCVDAGGTASGYVTWPAGDTDAIDGEFGVRTMIYSVTADRGASSYAIPTTINTANVTLARWTHTITALPTDGYSYNVWHESAAIGFKVWYNGQGWIYHGSGVDTTTFPANALQVGDTLEVEYDYNGGTERRYYRHNGTTVHTDTTGTIDPIAEIAAVCITTGDYIGPISYYVEYSGCTPDYAIQPVGQSGGSVVSGTPGSGSVPPFDVLYWLVNEIPDPVLEVEVNS